MRVENPLRRGWNTNAKPKLINSSVPAEASFER
jgi:hypothetical protein